MINWEYSSAIILSIYSANFYLNFVSLFPLCVFIIFVFINLQYYKYFFSFIMLYLIEFIVIYFHNHGLEDCISRNTIFTFYRLALFFPQGLFRHRVPNKSSRIPLELKRFWSVERKEKKKNAKRRWSALARGHVHAPGKALSCVSHRAMERNATAVR